MTEVQNIWSGEHHAFLKGHHHGYSEATELAKLLAAGVAKRYEREEDWERAKIAGEICTIIFQHHTICRSCLGRDEVQRPTDTPTPPGSE